MSRGLDLAITNRNLVSEHSELSSLNVMSPLVISSVPIPTDDIITPAGANSMMIGPLTINTGMTISVGANGSLTIV
tara:strand:- start:1999 stop:2226 length:228 start_codon:yes stop_codon:yes gene_type:complete